MLEKFKVRDPRLERIDTGDYTAEEYARWQQEMVLVHRWFGETRAIRSSLRIHRANESVLDIGAGSGELLHTVMIAFPNTGLLCGVDVEMEAAIKVRSRGFASIVSDGTKLPFADSSFDHVISSLVFHHFSDETAVGVLREMARVARRSIQVIDLRRSPIAYWGYKLAAAFLFQKLTRDDGALSILRSFSDDELLTIGEQAGLRDLSVKRSALFRLVLSGSK